MRAITAREVTHSIAATGECWKALFFRLEKAGLVEPPLPLLLRIHIDELTLKLDGPRKHKSRRAWHFVMMVKCLFIVCVPLRL